ncbi:hypothetical protein AURDEDRAFT_168186 [Auricularia subglabra TFB-10046 SS5]|nr:hypothetical protein AURDEDRAFT_168186 [Auricularia subglabra TFB-10046 SS5]
MPSPGPPPKRVKLEESPTPQPEAGDEDKEHCIICLQDIADRTILPNCAHEKFCFECVVVWTEQSRKCPLCQQGIGPYLIHHVRSQFDYQKYFLPPLRLSPIADRPPPRSSYRQPSTRTARARVWGQREDRLREDEEQRAIEKRRWVYRHNLYAKHVASNTYTKYRPLPTPSQFASQPDLIARATTFVKRELAVWNNIDGDFLTTFVISLMKSLDLRSETAVKLLSEFLDMGNPYVEGNRYPNAEHFAHEVYSYVRSPFRELTVYDRHVQPPAVSHPPLSFTFPLICSVAATNITSPLQVIFTRAFNAPPFPITLSLSSFDKTSPRCTTIHTFALLGTAWITVSKCALSTAGSVSLRAPNDDSSNPPPRPALLGCLSDSLDTNDKGKARATSPPPHEPVPIAKRERPQPRAPRQTALSSIQAHLGVAQHGTRPQQRRVKIDRKPLAERIADGFPTPAATDKQQQSDAAREAEVQPEGIAAATMRNGTEPDGGSSRLSAPEIMARTRARLAALKAQDDVPQAVAQEEPSAPVPQTAALRDSLLTRLEEEKKRLAAASAPPATDAEERRLKLKARLAAEKRRATLAGSSRAPV